MSVTIQRLSPRTSSLALACLCCVAAVACGDGDGPTDGDGDATAVISAQRISTPPDTVEIQLSLRSGRAAAGMQVDVVVNPAVFPQVLGVGPLGRADDLTAPFPDLARGRFRILLFEPDGSASLPAGDGAVAVLGFIIPPDAPAGPTPVTLEAALVVDADGDPFETTVEPGEITVVR